jgi:ubiquinone/menaquinone biosynthesis C-methylase UbiE
VDVTEPAEAGVPFVRFDGRRLPVEDASVDAVLLLYVLHHAADDAALLREARRVVRPGGVVVIGEDQVETASQRAVTVGFHAWLWTFTFMGWKGEFRKTAAWRARFADAGFTVEQAIDHGPHLGKRLWPRNTVFVLRPAG